MTGAAGTSFSMDNGVISWGFDISKWYADNNANDDARKEKDKKQQRSPDDLNVIVSGNKTKCSDDQDQKNEVQIQVGTVKDADKVTDVKGFGEVSDVGVKGDELQAGVSLPNKDEKTGTENVTRAPFGGGPGIVYLQYTAKAGGNITLNLYVTLNAAVPHYWGKEYEKQTVAVENINVSINCDEAPKETK
jgi:hypothetical protein